MYSKLDAVAVFTLTAVFNLVIARFWRRLLRFIIVATRIGFSLTLAVMVVVLARAMRTYVPVSDTEL